MVLMIKYQLTDCKEMSLIINTPKMLDNSISIKLIPGMY